MYFKTDATPAKIVFDIYDVMTTAQSQDLLSRVFLQMDQNDKNRIQTDSKPIWLLRKDSEEGVLTIESSMYPWKESGWVPNQVQLRLTKNGWQSYEEKYDQSDVLEITKTNITEHLSALQERLKGDYRPENMIYPELQHELSNKKMKALPEGDPYKVIRPCPNRAKGILNRSDMPSSPGIQQQKPEQLSPTGERVTQHFKIRLTEDKAIHNDPIGLAKEFHTKHSDVRKNESFKFARKSTIDGSEELSKILGHALKRNNRTREVCVKLGWLNKDGTLAEKVPHYIKEAYREAYREASKDKSHQPEPKK